MEYYAVERKSELLPFAIAWMELGHIMLGEISQVVREKLPYDLTYKWTNQQKKQMSKIEPETWK